MSTAVEQQPIAQENAAEQSLLDRAVTATVQTDPSQAKELLKALTQSALDGTVTWQRNLVKTINAAVSAIDETISKQLAAIMHNQEFSKLEGSWRGLEHLIKNSETSAGLKIRVMNLSKRELYKDLDRAVEFDQSQIFKKLYENEFGTPGGEPYGALIGDYEFSNHPDDIDTLSKMSNVAAAAFCPFLTSAESQFMGFNEWSDLAKPRDLEKIFDSAEYAKWRSFRDSDDSRFVVLTMPRVLARLPYGEKTKKVDEFNYEELPARENGTAKAGETDDFCWMNAAYALGTKLTNAFSKYGWCTAIRGAENGGKVEDLPFYTFVSDDGDVDAQCPTEVGITDRREAELSKLGFLPLSHYKNTDYAVFFGAETTQKAKKYDNNAATENAAISARLPYLMATSRFSHYLKVMARDKIGSFMEAEDVEAWLNKWIMQYVNANAKAQPELKSKYPLAEARVEVQPVPGNPGAYHAVAHLRPWLQMEELTASMRLVARIPEAS